jgi:hypothetical protein
MSPRWGLDTKTYWLTGRQSQCDFDFDKISKIDMICFAKTELIENFYIVSKKEFLVIWYTICIYVRYVHLRKAKHVHNRQTDPLVRTMTAMVHSKQISGPEPKGLSAKMNWLVVSCQSALHGQSPAGKYMSTVAEESTLFGSRYLATRNEDIEDDVCCTTLICRVCRSVKLL